MKNIGIMDQTWSKLKELKKEMGLTMSHIIGILVEASDKVDILKMWAKIAFDKKYRPEIADPKEDEKKYAML